MENIHNVILIGSGPAAHTCGIYLGRANLNPLMLEGDYTQEICPGGLLTTTKTVENFPGFPDGVDGYELTERFKAQSTKFGLTIKSKSATSILKTENYFVVSCGDEQYKTKAIVIATGSNPNKLEIENYDKFVHNGISTCAVCDAGLPCYRNVEIAVVGGGDSACEEALYITNTASKVYLIHRRDELKASKIMQERVLKHPKIEIIWNTVIAKVEGDKNLSRLYLQNVVTGELSQLDISGLFVAIGHKPNTDFVKEFVELDSSGYIITDKYMKTNMEGVWACGDVQDPDWKQAITASASGCIAALSVEKWLNQ